MDKHLFSTRTGGMPPADAVNHAGGKAYAAPPKEALAKYAATGMFGDTFYVDAKQQLDEVLKLCSQVEPEFIAKCAVYGRRNGYLRDMPALLLAAVAAQAKMKFDDNGARRALRQAFPLVIDNGKMLRNFVQAVRSGATGRKSFGHAPRTLIQSWFDARSDDQLFNAQVGNDPSLADVIKMVHPKPSTPGRAALLRHLIGRELSEEQQHALPPIVVNYERYKSGGRSLVALDVLLEDKIDFRLLDALQLSQAGWTRVAMAAPWKMTRMNLNTFQRQGVFKDPAAVRTVAERLRNPCEVRRSRCFPYELLTAFQNIDTSIPGEIAVALQDAMEIAVENVPSIPGRIALCVDVSGSMHSAVAGARRGHVPKTRCIDAAALIAAVFLRKNPDAILLPFSDRLNLDHRINPRDSVMTIAARIAALPSGGTDCSLPLALLNANRVPANAVIYASDNESWVDIPRWGQQTSMAHQWGLYKRLSPGAKLVCIDITPNTGLQAPSAPDRLNVGGFGDAVFTTVGRFLEHGNSASHWVNEIEATSLDFANVKS